MKNKELIKKIIKKVAKNWEYESEYAGRMETWCFYCGKYQDKKWNVHEKNCLSLKARELLKQK